MIALVGAMVAVGSTGCASTQPTHASHVGAATTRHDSSSVSSVLGNLPAEGRGSFVVDLAWADGQVGWALIASPCARGLCAVVARTSNSGATWRRLPNPPARIEYGRGGCGARHPCITRISFATRKVGYLYGPLQPTPTVFMTTDAGRTWSRVSSPAVESLTANRRRAVRVVYNHSGCPGPCSRTVQATTPGSTTWQTLRRNLAGMAQGEATAQAIQQGRRVIYLPMYGSLASGAGSQHAVIYRSLDGGQMWTALHDPCGGSPNSGWFDTVSLAAADHGFLAALCDDRTTDQAEFLETSHDRGTTWGQRQWLPRLARSMQVIVAATPTNLVLSTPPTNGTGRYPYRLARSTDSGIHWHLILADAEQVPPAETSFPNSTLTFQTPTVSHWLTGKRTLWTTRDGGAHWTRSRVPAK